MDFYQSSGQLTTLYPHSAELVPVLSIHGPQIERNGINGCWFLAATLIRRPFHGGAPAYIFSRPWVIISYGTAGRFVTRSM